MASIALIWYFASIHLFFLLSMPKNLALEFNLSVQENIKCIEKERLALLSFKQGLVDEYDILSSWETRVNNDCCNWRGVQCSNSIHHHIIKLDLHGSNEKQLMGEVGSSLTQLSHLNYLDLSYNEFDRILLEDIGSLINLNYLNLSYNSFASVIPPHLGNLSKLSVLDLGRNHFLNDNFRWLLSFSSLKHLDLSSVDFHGANDWASVINKFPMLESLSLRECNLSQPVLPSPHSNTNFSIFLVELDLSSNYNLNSSIFYSWLINFTRLVHLNLAANNLQGLDLGDFENMTSLVFLDLTLTNVNFHSLKSFENLCNLNSLYLSNNNIGGLLSDFLKAFPQCILNSLQYLYLLSNKFIGFLPNFTMLPSLKELDLSYNMLSGTIPKNLGQLSNLEYIGLDQNLLKGEVSETHFSKLTHLKKLNLFNCSLNFNFKSDWVPSFQLEEISLRYNKLGPLFPKWFQTQNFSIIDISFTKISDIIPHWFWESLSPNLVYLDLSGNEIMGEIPDLSVKFKRTFLINLQSNKFVGRIPAFLFQATLLDFSNNNFSDLSCLCEIVNSPLGLLDLFNNQLSGQLPNCWEYSMPNLTVLDLSHNYISGDLPQSMSKLISLDSLILRNNQFSGGLDYLFNLTNLAVIDAMNNNLSGTIPSWIGSKLPNLAFLNLKSNNFHGNLPSSVCKLKNIQVLDISSNNVSGSIPTCIRNFIVLTQTLHRSDHYPDHDLNDLAIVWKGQERLITGQVLELERIIDLSHNHLTGKIPNEITELVGLITLNLSYNELTGQIPNNMGQLQSLDSLDLSRNHLSGPIPSSFSQIDRLSMLDLSYNNLSGRIPTGTQLRGFPTSTYEGNPYLCGDPLQKCFDEETTQEPNINNVHVENENEDRVTPREFFISMTFGYIVGFWGIFGSLVFHRRWRHAYFKFIGDIIN